ncbi:MAG: type IV secretory system conjugative DNA transfer family protein [Rhodoplanes sp.]
MGADQVTRFARVDFRSDERVFGIKDEDRLLHFYIIGKTGTGKSTLLENMALQDLERGHGFALIDPHGDLVARLAARVAPSRRHGVIYLDATDPDQPYGYNPLRHVREDRIALAASGMMDVFKKMWPDAWGVRMEHILRNVLMALLEQPDATLHEVLRIFSDKEFRLRVGKSLRNETIRSFLLHEFDQFSFGYRADGTAPIQNKVGAFLADPLLNRMLTAPEKDLRIRQVMDRGQVLLVNLAKGRIGDDSSSLLGGLLVTAIGLAAHSRADMPEAQRRDFFVYIDEFQSFTTLALASMLSELRKYRVGFTIAHQYIHQLEPDIRHAVFGNVGSVISFRVGAEDAPYLVREFHERFSHADFLQLPNHRIYLKLMIDGMPSAPFSAVTLKPAALPDRALGEGG